MSFVDQRADCTQFLDDARRGVSTKRHFRRGLNLFARWVEEQGDDWAHLEWNKYVKVVDEDGAVTAQTPIERRHIEQFLSWLRSTGATAQNLGHHLQAVRAYFAHLQRIDQLADEPTRGIRVGGKIVKDPEALTTEEIERLLDALRHGRNAERNYTLGFVLAWTGYRLGEIIALRTEDILAEEHLVRLHDTKTARLAVRVLPQPALERINYWLTDPKRKPSQWVFPGQSAGSHMSDSAAWLALSRAGQRAGISVPSNGRELRRAFASHLHDAGMQDPAVSQALGHYRQGSKLPYLDRKIRARKADEALAQSRIVHLCDTGKIRPLSE